MPDAKKRNYMARVVDSKKRLFIFQHPADLGVVKLTIEDLCEIVHREFPDIPLNKILVKTVQEPDQIIIYQE